MTEHNLFYYAYASFTNAQLPLLKVAALYFNKLVLLDPVGTSWVIIGAHGHAWEGRQAVAGRGHPAKVTSPMLSRRLPNSPTLLSAGQR